MDGNLHHDEDCLKGSRSFPETLYKTHQFSRITEQWCCSRELLKLRLHDLREDKCKKKASAWCYKITVMKFLGNEVQPLLSSLVMNLTDKREWGGEATGRQLSVYQLLAIAVG